MIANKIIKGVREENPHVDNVYITGQPLLQWVSTEREITQILPPPRGPLVRFWEHILVIDEALLEEMNEQPRSH